MHPWNKQLVAKGQKQEKDITYTHTFTIQQYIISSPLQSRSRVCFASHCVIKMIIKIHFCFPKRLVVSDGLIVSAFEPSAGFSPRFELQKLGTCFGWTVDLTLLRDFVSKTEVQKNESTWQTSAFSDDCKLRIYFMQMLHEVSSSHTHAYSIVIIYKTSFTHPIQAEVSGTSTVTLPSNLLFLHHCCKGFFRCLQNNIFQRNPARTKLKQDLGQKAYLSLSH